VTAVAPLDVGPSPPLLLVGNPNVGKSVIFGALTRTYVTVCNYPGTTVELTRGTAALLPSQPEIVDTPGTNSLLPQSDDERVTRDVLLDEPGATVVQVGDMKNLRRVLYLTLQLAELGRRQLLVLNLEDEALILGMRVRSEEIERRLGVPVVPTTAVRGLGLDQIPRRLAGAAVASLEASYPAAVERAAVEVAARLPEHFGPARRGLALMLLAGDSSLLDWLGDRLAPADRDDLARRAAVLERRLGRPVSSALAEARHRAVAAVVEAAVEAPVHTNANLRDRLGALSMHPIWGVPVLAAVLFVAYEFVGVFGAGTLVNLMENGLFGKVINPGATWLVQHVLPWQPAQDFLVGEYGVISMGLTYAIAIVLPVVGTFFIFFGLLEDSGYLPRLAVMLNKVFKLMGLNGKAVLPMVLGLGCDTMATLTTRILPSRKERVLVTLLLALGVPCSAQLGVILAMLASMSPLGTLIWGMVVAGTLIGVGWAAAKLIPGKASEFLLEIPPLRMPSPANIAIKTLARTEWYLKEAVPLFVLGTILLFGLDAVGVLPILQHASEPLVTGFLGLPAKTADAFLIGFLRRDYGAAGLLKLQQGGQLDGIQVVVSLVVITLFVPCVANFFMMIKERGLKAAVAMVAFIVPFAFVVGGILNWVLRALALPL
jgi:ferrous iron transport protein B